MGGEGVWLGVGDEVRLAFSQTRSLERRRSDDGKGEDDDESITHVITCDD